MAASALVQTGSKVSCGHSCACPYDRASLKSIQTGVKSKLHRVPRYYPAAAKDANSHSRKSLVHQAPAVRSQSAVVMASSAEKTVLVPLGNGTEEMEAVTIIDVFRRAGANVTVASVESDLTVVCSRDVKIVADELMNKAAQKQYDLIVLPVSDYSLHIVLYCQFHIAGLHWSAQGGAPGSEALRRSDELKHLLQQQHSSNKAYAAICAAPAVVLEAHGLLKGKKATSHPGFVDKLSDSR